MLSIAARAVLGLASSLKGGGVIVNEHCLTAADIRTRVDMLGRYFEFIHHDDLLARLATSRRKPFCLLTFDDGKKSNATVVAPELERLGVPAVFYVTTGFVDGAAPLWFDRYEALVQRSGAPFGLARTIVKQLPYPAMMDRLERACERAQVTCDLGDADIAPLTWEDVLALSRKGFSIGAHTVDHPVLTCLPEADALAQIDRSIRAIQDRVGRCPSFAFTNGNYTARLARHAIASGAATAMTTEPVWATGAFPRWRLPRVQLHPGQAPAKMQLKLAAGAVPGLLCNPDGTGRLYRRIQRLQRRQNSGGSVSAEGATVRPLRWRPSHTSRRHYNASGE